MVGLSKEMNPERRLKEEGDLLIEKYWHPVYMVKEGREMRTPDRIEGRDFGRVLSYLPTDSDDWDPLFKGPVTYALQKTLWDYYEGDKEKARQDLFNRLSQGVMKGIPRDQIRAIIEDFDEAQDYRIVTVRFGF